VLSAFSVVGRAFAVSEREHRELTNGEVWSAIGLPSLWIFQPSDPCRSAFAIRGIPDDEA
jgi:hypothetical protein